MVLSEGRYDVLCRGRRVGYADVDRRGAYTVVSCRCPVQSASVTRLCAAADGEGPSLGVMVPRGGELWLEKRLSRSQLSALGPGTVRRFVLSFDDGVPDGWEPCPEAGALFRDPLLRRISVRGALTRQRDGLRELAVPWSPEAPFPLAPLFCLGRLLERDGRDYLLFFIRDGSPVTGPERSPASSRPDPR